MNMASAEATPGFAFSYNGWAFVCQAMDETRAEASALFDAAMALPYSSARNPQVCGTSMGGLIAQMIFAENKAFVSMVSNCRAARVFTRPMTGVGRPQRGTGSDDWCAKYGDPVPS